MRCILARYDTAYAAAFEKAKLQTVKELRAALAARQIGWADLIEKRELAARTLGGGRERSHVHTQPEQISWTSLYTELVYRDAVDISERRIGNP